MRKSIILGAALALFGVAAIAQASDRQGSADRDRVSVTGQASDDSRGERHDRYERKDHRDDRHDESRERSRERHDESSKRHDRR